jgi:hypothetical protein
MVLETTHSSGRVGTKTMPIIVATRRFTGYKYLLRLTLKIILHSFFSFLPSAYEQWKIREVTSALALPLRREVYHRAVLQLHRRHLLDHRHH